LKQKALESKDAQEKEQCDEVAEDEHHFEDQEDQQLTKDSQIKSNFSKESKMTGRSYISMLKK